MQQLAEPMRKKRDEGPRGRYAKSEISVGKILEAAGKLFIARSYAEVTMADIAETAGMTKGGLYHHFQTKEELYLVMMHRYLGEQERLFRSAVAKGETCREQLRLLTVQFLTQPAESYQMMQLVRRDVNIFEGESRDRLIRSYQAALPEVEEEIIRKGMEKGELPRNDARLLSWLHVAMVEVVLSGYARNVVGSSEKLGDYVLGVLFDGLLSGESVGSGPTRLKGEAS